MQLLDRGSHLAVWHRLIIAWRATRSATYERSLLVALGIGGIGREADERAGQPASSLVAYRESALEVVLLGQWCRMWGNKLQMDPPQACTLFPVTVNRGRGGAGHGIMPPCQSIRNGEVRRDYGEAMIFQAMGGSPTWRDGPARLGNDELG